MTAPAFLTQNELSCAFLNHLTQQFGDKNYDSESKKCILVDLSHDWPEYLLYNLLVGKFLQRQHGCRLVGLALHTKVIETSCSRYSLADIKALAGAFGINDIVYLAREDFETWNKRHARHLSEYLVTGDPNSFEEKLFGHKSEGYNTFQTAYESTLRGFLTTRFSGTKDPRFLTSLGETLQVQAVLDEVFSHYQITAVVTGHTSYNPWRLLCEKAQDCNAGLYYLFISRTVALWKLPQDRKLRPDEWREQANQRSFEAIELNETAQAFFNFGAPLHAQTGAERLSFALKNPTARQMLRASIRQQLGIAAQAKVYTLYAHTFSDIPLCASQAFPDLAAWYEETLAYARNRTDITWIIKPHPLDKVYDTTGFIAQSKSACQNFPHIKFADDSLSRHELLAITDLAITVRGSIGFEAPMLGIPALCAGRGPYSACKTASIVTDKASYFTALEVSPALKPEALTHARCYYYFDQLVGDVPSSAFVPAGTYFRDQTLFLAESCRNLQSYRMELDPFYHAFVKLQSEPYGRATRILGPVLPHTATHHRTKFSFIACSSDVECLIAGFHAPEAGGTWTARQTATVMLGIPPTLRHCHNIIFTIVSNKLDQRQNAKVVIGQKEFTLQTGETIITVPRAEISDDILMMHIHVSELPTPYSLGINNDERSLGICFREIVFET